MRITSSVAAVSWIPREAVEAAVQLPFRLGVMTYDPPPPEEIEDLEAWLSEGSFRFANVLSSWIEVSDEGTIVGHGCEGGSRIGSRGVRLGHDEVAYPEVDYPDLRPEPEVSEDWVRFTQTAGGRSGLPAPRRLRGAVAVSAPPEWTTLALTLNADGNIERELAGASSFPRHWLYDERGHLITKTSVIDFDRWYYRSPEAATPWGGVDDVPMVAPAESALEHRLSEIVIDADPTFRRLGAGSTLVEEGDPGGEVFVLFDGVIAVEQGGTEIARLGPGAIVGEMALVDGGARTATLRAVTTCRIALVPGERLKRNDLEELARTRRE